MGFQTITGGAGAKFTLAGWFKASGAVKAQVMVQAFAEGNKQNQFIQVKYAQGETDWTAFAKEITLPPWTASFNIGLLVEGNGSAWLDEVHEASTAIDKGTSGDAMTSGPPEKDKPAVPGWGFYPQFPNAWLATHQSFVERAKRGDIDVIFYGDSITQGWGIDGKAIWDKRYAPYKAVNFGMGGDSTRQVLWRITHGELDGLHPKLVVLMIGTNNLYSDFNAGTDGEIADGIGLIVDELRQKLPNVRVLLMGLLPRQNEYFCQRIANINLTISKLAGRNRQVRFLDLGPQFMSAPGVVMPKLYNADQLHLVGAGYQVWADAMQPLFDAMLGKKSVKWRCQTRNFPNNAKRNQDGTAAFSDVPPRRWIRMGVREYLLCMWVWISAAACYRPFRADARSSDTANRCFHLALVRRDSGRLVEPCGLGSRA